MCVIVSLDAGKKLDVDVLKHCYDNNPDGWGIMWPEKISLDKLKSGEQPDQLWYAKDTTNFDAFLAVWKDVPENVNRAIHFRIKTHGKINKDNCHPFFISENLGLMHNGIVDVETPKADFSDTWHFVHHDLKALIGSANTDILEEGYPVYNIVDEMAGYSRFLFMDNFGRVVKFSTWHKAHGVEFSNATSHYSKKVTTYSGYGGYYDSDGYDWRKGSFYNNRVNKSKEENVEDNVVALIKADDTSPRNSCCVPEVEKTDPDLLLIEAEVENTLTEEEKAEGISLQDVEFDTYDKANQYRKENGGFVKVGSNSTLFTVCNTRVKLDKADTSDLLTKVHSLITFDALSDEDKLLFIKKYPSDTLDLLSEAMYGY